MDAHTVGNHGDGLPSFYFRIVGGLEDAGFSEGDDVIFRRLGTFREIGAGDFAPVESFVFEHHDGIGIVPRGLHEAFHVGSIAGIRDLYASYREEAGFDTIGMVRTTAAVRTDRYPYHTRHGKFSAREVMGF